jgi:hypothetical protein
MSTRTLAFCFALALPLTGFAADPDQVDRYKKKDGTEVELHSGQPTRPPDGPAPPFAELDRNADKLIDSDEAAAYRLLGDDFNHADDNHDGRISADEYARWAAKK